MKHKDMPDYKKTSDDEKTMIFYDPEKGSMNGKEIMKYARSISDLGFKPSWFYESGDILKFLEKNHSKNKNNDNIVGVITGLDRWLKEEKIYEGTLLAKSVYEKYHGDNIIPVILATYQHKINKIPLKLRRNHLKYFTGGVYTDKKTFRKEMKKYI